MQRSLKEIIKNTIIQKSKPIGFDEFMDLALYYPAKGYYSGGMQKFGEQGDFITAPETSDLFGFCLARQCTQILDGTNDILEFGAGSGVLAAQVLFELGRLGQLPKNYYILELSAELQQRQQDTIAKILPELMDRVVWLNGLPENFSGVVIANEVLDAMPAKRLIYQAGKFKELGVDCQNDALVWQTKSIYNNDKMRLPTEVTQGYTTEVNERAIAWVESLSETMDKGLVLLIDYGIGREEYFHPQRGAGTLRCYYQHKASENPFVHIGKQDITTSVNFSDIAEAAERGGFEVQGYATQALFLISLGIDEYLLAEQETDKRASLAQQVKQLVLPSAMGESFKVLALVKDTQVELQGFKEQNLLHKL
ncbi:SAM-dependent methyltransferase, MidA [uncultured Gammaproteobacteria bacterium]|nr:SAM-dependent methyltransferase, MidA [uncultured Gammaproteobacteria bacterium]